MDIDILAAIKYQSRTSERTGDGTVNTLVYQGSRQEMIELQSLHPINEYGNSGRLKSSRVFQGDGTLWHCELRYEADSGGDSVDAPVVAYGRKSAQLRGAMLSLPLEVHPDYRTYWNYYLVSAPGISQSPAWYLTATDLIIPSADQEKWEWVKSPGERKSGWNIVQGPEMPGINSYDIAVYSVVETARFRSAAAAGKMVAGVLNKIGAPNNKFGIEDGDWKCDDATVSWSGRYWLATLTWTRSGDASGWNQTLYHN